MRSIQVQILRPWMLVSYLQSLWSCFYGVLLLRQTLDSASCVKLLLPQPRAALERVICGAESRSRQRHIRVHMVRLERELHSGHNALFRIPSMCLRRAVRDLPPDSEFTPQWANRSKYDEMNSEMKSRHVTQKSWGTIMYMTPLFLFT